MLYCPRREEINPRDLGLGKTQGEVRWVSALYQSKGPESKTKDSTRLKSKSAFPRQSQRRRRRWRWWRRRQASDLKRIFSKEICIRPKEMDKKILPINFHQRRIADLIWLFLIKLEQATIAASSSSLLSSNHSFSTATCLAHTEKDYLVWEAIWGHS